MERSGPSAKRQDTRDHLETEADVTVVGAGFGGLTAADALAKAGVSVVVLEARDRVGGRAYSVKTAGAVVDLGGQWTGPAQQRILRLAKSLGAETIPTFSEGENVIEVDGRMRTYKGSIPRIGPLVLADFAQASWRINRAASKMPLEDPGLAPKAVALDSRNASDLLRRTVLTARGRRFFEVAASTIWGAESPGSALHMLFYIASAGGLDALLKTEGGGQQESFAGGAQTLCERLADAVGLDRIRLGSSVSHIATVPDGVVVSSKGCRVRSKRVVVAVPMNLVGRIEFDPALPAHRRSLVSRVRQGAIIKCAAIYGEPFWRQAGLTGHGMSDRGPFSVTFDASNADASRGVLVTFVGGRATRAFSDTSPAERRRAVLEYFSRLFGAGARVAEAYVEHDWPGDEWSLGGPACHFPRGAWTSCGVATREPCGPIHWAGTETAVVRMGFMDGAVESGERAAREVIESL